MKEEHSGYVTADEGAAISNVRDDQLAVVSRSDSTTSMQLDHDCARAAADVSRVAVLPNVGVARLLESVTDVSRRGEAVVSAHEQELR